MSGVTGALYPALRTLAVAAMLTLLINAGYSLAFLVWRGMSLPEVLRILSASAPFVVLGFFLAVVGAILGDRLAAYRPGPRARLSGLAVGAGLALIVVLVSLIQESFDPWLPPNAGLAVLGGWLGAGLDAHA